MGSALRVKIWRRGRGVIDWLFLYLNFEKRMKKPDWYSSPGWYHKARKHVYRLTLDHDYPNKPLWLGRRKGARWECMEGLYEPILVLAHKCSVINLDAISGGSGRRSAERKRVTKAEVRNAS